MTADAADALARGWATPGELTADDVGVNNQVWRVAWPDGTAWLRRWAPEDAAWRRRELDLLERLGDALGPRAIRIPAVVPTTRGEAWLELASGLWAVMTDVPGTAPVPSDLDAYPHLARGLAELHHVLDELEVAHPVAPTRILDDLADRLSDRARPSSPAIERACDAVARGYARLSAEPRGLIHGDFSHPNLRYADGALTGALDFEFVSEDPRILDLATLALTAIVRSGARDPGPTLRAIGAAYAATAGAPVDGALLRVAVLARKLDSCWYHARRLADRQGSPEVAARQDAQLATVLAAIDAGQL